MRIISVLLIVTCLSVSVAAPQNNDQAAPQKSQDNPILNPKIVELPLSKRGFRPKITLQEALKLAESYIEKEKIDSSSYYLFEARMIQYGNDKDAKQPRWFFWWVHENGSVGNYIQITISMDGKAARLPSM